MPAERSASLSLFSAERVASPRRDRWVLTEYQRLDQAIGGAADRVRRLIDDWYRSLPPHAQPEIRRRFTERSLGAHLGAFWEMYLYAATRRLGFEVDIDVVAITANAVRTCWLTWSRLRSSLRRQRRSATRRYAAISAPGPISCMPRSNESATEAF